MVDETMNPTALAKKANKSLSKYGQPMIFVQETEGPVGPDTMHPTVDTIPTPFVGMWDNPKLEEMGNLIQVGDAVIWASGAAIPEPDTTDWIRVQTSGSDEAWDIINIDKTKPGTVAILYKLFVRHAGSAKEYQRREKP